MRLDLRFTHRPPHTFWCEAIAGFIHEDSFTTEENMNMAGVDQKTSAYLRSLNKRGFCSGEIGETLLLAGEHRLKADKVVLKGLGPKEEITMDLFLAQANALSVALRALSVGSFAVKIPVLFNSEHYNEQVRGAVQEMITPFLSGRYHEPDYILTAVFSTDGLILENIADVQRPLKEYFGDDIPFSLVTESSARSSEM